MGKHRGKPDPAEAAERKNEYRQGESPQRTAALFDASVGSAVTAVADKRLRGEIPYDNEPGSKGTVTQTGRRSDATERRRSR